MQDRYKIVISSKNIYKEIDLLPSVPEIRIGTETECEIRLSKSLFFEKVELYFSQKNGQWAVFCSDNLYLDTGDLRKLLTIQLRHGDTFSLKYQNSDNEVFSVEFLIDFDNGQRKYERAIDVSSCNSITIGSDNSNNIVLRSQYTKSDLIELNRSNNGFVLNVKRTSFGVYHNGTKVNGRCILGNGDFFSVSDFIFYFKDQLIWTEIRNELYIHRFNVTILQVCF